MKKKKKNEEYWTIEEQKTLLQKIGYDSLNWDPGKQEEVGKAAFFVKKAIISHRDQEGNILSEDEINLLYVVVELARRAY